MILATPPAIVHHLPGKLGLPPSARDRAVGRIEAELAAERALPLQEGAQSLAYLHHELPPRGTLIMFHGFTAGTWQFEPLARQAYEAGYDVYVPRLPGQGLFLATHAVDLATHGQAAPLLNGLTFSWGEECRRDTAAGKRPGHSYFFGGNAYGATELGWKVIADAPKLKATVQLFATAVDDAADEDTLRALYHRLPSAGWYYYPAAEGIPHPMVHPMEDKGRGQCPALYQTTLKFLETGEPQTHP